MKHHQTKHLPFIPISPQYLSIVKVKNQQTLTNELYMSSMRNCSITAKRVTLIYPTVRLYQVKPDNAQWVNRATKGQTKDQSEV